jgi:hypothetical protein
MTTGGWVMLILSWGFILGLTAFCFGRVLASKADGKDSGDNP